MLLYLKYADILFDEVDRGLGHEKKKKKNLLDTIYIYHLPFPETVTDDLN